MKQIIDYNMFDDLLMRAVLADVPATQHVLRVLLRDPALVVEDVRVQHTVSRLGKRGVICDAFVVGGDGRRYEVEVQKKDDCDHAKRMRFYSAVLDSQALEKGDDFDQLSDLRMLYISRTDIWHGGKAVYTVEKRFKETGDEYVDGLYMMFCNAEVDDGSREATILRYMATCDPSDMSEGPLSRRVRDMKTSEEGLREMKELSEEIFDEGKAEGIAEGKAQGAQNKLLELVRSVMQGFGVTLEMAMDRLGLTHSDREYCLANIAQPA